MRRLLTFQCDGASLGATLDGVEGRSGILFVTGGTQMRIGSHRMTERLAKALAEAGYPCFRFDCRGVGDSEGKDPGFRGSAADIAAAAAAFRGECPRLELMIGFGLCDGATALALFGAKAGVNGLILANPWLVEAEAGTPPPAAVKAHYFRRLTSLEGWKKILTGSISYKKLLKGIFKITTPADRALGEEVAAALDKGGMPAELILSRGDNTAIAAAAVWKSPLFQGIRDRGSDIHWVESDSHTFARSGDDGALLRACLAALAALSGRR